MCVNAREMEARRDAWSLKSRKSSVHCVSSHGEKSNVFQVTDDDRTGSKKCSLQLSKPMHVCKSCSLHAPPPQHTHTRLTYRLAHRDAKKERNAPSRGSRYEEPCPDQCCGPSGTFLLTTCGEKPVLRQRLLVLIIHQWEQTKGFGGAQAHQSRI